MADNKICGDMKNLKSGGTGKTSERLEEKKKEKKEAKKEEKKEEKKEAKKEEKKEAKKDEEKVPHFCYRYSYSDDEFGRDSKKLEYFYNRPFDPDYEPPSYGGSNRNQQNNISTSSGSTIPWVQQNQNGTNNGGGDGTRQRAVTNSIGATSICNDLYWQRQLPSDAAAIAGSAAPSSRHPLLRCYNDEASKSNTEITSSVHMIAHAIREGNVVLHKSIDMLKISYQRELTGNEIYIKLEPMGLGDDVMASAIIFLADNPKKARLLFSTPIPIRKAVLQQMMSKSG